MNPTATAKRSRELAGATAREVTMACDARMQHGRVRTTGAVGIDAAARPRRSAPSTQVREPQRRRQLPAARHRLRQPRRNRARVRAAGPHPRATGPVRPAAPQPPAARERHVRRRQDDGGDHPAEPGTLARRRRVHHRPGRALRVSHLADPGRKRGRDRRRGSTPSTRGTSRTPAACRRRRSTICWRCTRCCSASTTQAATATACQTSSRTCSGSRSGRCTSAAP